MSTRSLTVVIDENGEELGVMYRHCDGYPKGHGRDLEIFLKGRKILDTASVDNSDRLANGMSNLFAQMVCNFTTMNLRTAIGIHLHKAGTRNLGEVYIYTVTFNGLGNDAYISIEDIIEGNQS